MPSLSLLCFGGCNNDTRYPERIIKRGHVQELKFHHFPKDPEKRTVWVLKYPTIKLCVPTILRMENQHLETLYQLYDVENFRFISRESLKLDMLKRKVNFSNSHNNFLGDMN